MAADRALWLPEALARFGVKFVEIDGWRTRGRPGGMVDYRGHLRHHTAGGGRSAAPSLNVVLQGRPDVEGPLCQVLLGRDRVARIIAAGRCNHAGLGSGCVRYGIPADRGGWYTTGLEVEHAGTAAETWTDDMIDASRRVDAAMLWGQGRYGGLDLTGLVRMWGHKEYAPDRKIDPYRLNMNTERAAVAELLRAGGAEDELSAADVQQIIAHVDSRLDDIARVAWAWQIPNPLNEDKTTAPAQSLLRVAADRAHDAATSATEAAENAPDAVWTAQVKNPLDPEGGATNASSLLRVAADHSYKASRATAEILTVLREIRDHLVPPADTGPADTGQGPGGGG